jgi:hypothetical protein
MRISVNIPSLHRPECLTAEYLKGVNVNIWVEESEVSEYQRANPKANIIACEKGINGNIARVRNHILEKEFQRGVKGVCFVDDDMRGLFYWEGGIKHRVEPSALSGMLQKYSFLCREWGVVSVGRELLG